jgi:flagellar biosynthesis/type III secretory pathway chaperone
MQNGSSPLDLKSTLSDLFFNAELCLEKFPEVKQHFPSSNIGDYFLLTTYTEKVLANARLLREFMESTVSTSATDSKELKLTKLDLNSTQSQLQAANDRATELEQQLAKAITLAESRSDRDSLEKTATSQSAEIQALWDKIAELTENNRQLAQKNNDVAQAEKKVEALSKEVATLNALKPKQTARELDLTKKKLAKSLDGEKKLKKKIEDTKTSAQKVIADLNHKLDNSPWYGAHDSIDVNGERYMFTFFESELSYHVRESGITALPVDWHLEVMSSKGVAIKVTPTDYLRGVLPFSTEMRECWDTKVDDVILKIIAEKTKDTHPLNHQLVAQSKEIILADLDCLTDKEKELLQVGKLYNLYDVMSLSLTYYLQHVIQDENPSLEDGNEAYDIHKKLTGEKQKLMQQLGMSTKGKAFQIRDTAA